jgi:hypothetical protein
MVDHTEDAQSVSRAHKRRIKVGSVSWHVLDSDHRVWSGISGCVAANLLSRLLNQAPVDTVAQNGYCTPEFTRPHCNECVMVPRFPQEGDSGKYPSGEVSPCTAGNRLTSEIPDGREDHSRTPYLSPTRCNGKRGATEDGIVEGLSLSWMDLSGRSSFATTNLDSASSLVHLSGTKGREFGCGQKTQMFWCYWPSYNELHSTGR